MVAVLIALNCASEHQDLLVVFIFLISCSCATAKGIYCREGPAVTYKIPVNFSVREQPVTQFGCMDGLSSKESKIWPGPPENLAANVSSADGSFRLSWKPPDDSSAGDVIGFLLKMYIEELGDTNSFGPSTCYLVDSKLGSDHSSSGEVKQDAVFHLDCKLDRALNVRVKVVTLPVPQDRHYKEAVVFATFKGTTTWSSTTGLNPLSKMLTETPGDKLESASVVAISLGVLFVSVFVSTCVVFILCRTRRNSYGIPRSHFDNNIGISQRFKQHFISTSQEKTFSIKTTKHKVDDTKGDVEGTGAKTHITNDISQEYKEKDKCATDILNSQTACHKGSHLNETITGDKPIPLPYRIQLEMINLNM